MTSSFDQALGSAVPSKQTNKTKAIKTLLTSLSRLVTSPVFYQSPTYLATLIATLAKFAFHVGSFIFPLFFYRHHFLIRLINLSVSARQSARFDKAIAFCSRHLILFYFLNFFFEFVKPTCCNCWPWPSPFGRCGGRRITFCLA